MADHSKPTLTDTYANFLTFITNRLSDSLMMLDPAFTSPTNLPSGAIRWDSVNKYWSQYNGTTWTQLALGFAPLASPTFTGTPSGPTPSVNDNSTKFATTAYYIAQGSSIAPLMNGTATIGTSLSWARADHIHPTDTSKASLASPTFTGTPSGPTPATNTNTTQLATCAFVLGQASTTNPLLNGTATPGTSLLFARADHVHPTDTSLAPIASPNFTGTPKSSGINLATINDVNAVQGLPKNSQTFTSSGTFTVPTNITVITVVGSHAGGGGGPGGGGGSSCSTAGGGGGGAASVWGIPKLINVTPGQQFIVVIGAGGSSNALGGNTSFGSILYSNLFSSTGGGGGGGCPGVAGSGSGSNGISSPTAFVPAGSGGVAYVATAARQGNSVMSFYTDAGYGAHASSGGAGGTGGTSDCNNGSNGSNSSGKIGGAGGVGGSSKVIVYW